MKPTAYAVAIFIAALLVGLPAWGSDAESAYNAALAAAQAGNHEQALEKFEAAIKMGARPTQLRQRLPSIGGANQHQGNLRPLPWLL